METVDTLTPEGMARWLRETAANTRARGNGEWTGPEVRVAKHVAFRIEQAAEMIERLQAQLRVLAALGDRQTATAVMNTSTCPKCHQPMLNIPRMGIYHACPSVSANGDGNG